jgi:hypothetical protein
MPKLNDATAQKVADAEDGFKLLDPMIVLGQLKEVEVKPGKKGDYWQWKFVIPEGQPNAGRMFRENTSLSEAAHFRMKAVFNAFGVPTNTDTDDLLGCQVRLVIGQEIIGEGQRMGEATNTIVTLLPKDGPVGTEDSVFKESGVSKPLAVNPEAVAEASGAGGSTDEPLF